MLVQDDLVKLGEEIEGSMAIFCMATYGEGDPTDNAQDLYEWLKERTESLEGLQYAVSLSCACAKLTTNITHCLAVDRCLD